MSAKNNLIGVILVGGKSARMGQAKAHLCINGLPQWQFAEQSIAPFCDEVFFSVSKQLSPPIIVDDRKSIEDVFVDPVGPLGGIISAFRRFSDRALFVLACDLPCFDERAARYLYEHRDETKCATVFVGDGGLEPLCAIFEPRIKTELVRAWAEDRLCPRKILSALDVARIDVPEQKWLTNINHAHELASLMHKNVSANATSSSTRKVVVHYYADLKERAARAQEVVVSREKTVSALYGELQLRYGFAHDVSSLRFARNDQLILANSDFVDGDTIVFIPPVSGG